ncbi:MAG: hypothetical protein U1F61_03675 [Opitutaceae bacterium]
MKQPPLQATGTSNPLKRWAALMACGVLLGLGAAIAAPMTERMMIVTTDVTRAGEKVPPPTAERPVYYVPVFVGYSELGEVAQHYQRKPPEEPIQQAVVAALAKQHYLLASREHPPTLTIAIEWGTITPVFIGQTVINSAEIRARVLGDQEFNPGAKNAAYRPEMLSLSGRHYLVISAFAYQRKPTPNHPDMLLWRAHSSTDHWGHFLDETIQPLIAVATPALGRPTKPGVTWHDKTGQVEIGEAVVKETDVK